MKKITLFFICLFISVSMFAQQLTTNDVHKVASNFNSVKNTKSNDTILYGPVFYTAQTCIDTLDAMQFVGGGYLTGNGSLGTGHALLECSQGFDNVSPTTTGLINGAIASIYKVSGTSGKIAAKVYTVNSSFKPVTALGTSDSIDISTLADGWNQQVDFTFITPVHVTGPFAVSILLPTTAGDTIFVAMTRPGCVNSAKDGYAYVDATGYNWLQYKYIMTQNSMGSFDLFISAAETITTGVNNNEPLNFSVNIYPIPANDNLNISSLNKISEIKVINTIGQTISDQKVANISSFNLNTSNFKAGIYFVQIVTEKGTVCKKITIEK